MNFPPSSIDHRKEQWYGYCIGGLSLCEFIYNEGFPIVQTLPLCCTAELTPASRGSNRVCSVHVEALSVRGFASDGLTMSPLEILCSYFGEIRTNTRRHFRNPRFHIAVRQSPTELIDKVRDKVWDEVCSIEHRVGLLPGHSSPEGKGNAYSLG